MKLEPPTRIATSIGALLAAAGVALQETDWSHPLKQALTALIVFLAALVVHPAEGGVIAHPAAAPVVPVAPPAPPAPTPAAREAA